MKTLNASPLRPTTDLRMFVQIPTASGGMQIGRLVGVRNVRRQNRTVEATRLVRVWVAGRKTWQKTTWEVTEATFDAYIPAQLEDFIRVGLIIRNANGVWL